MFDLGDWFYCFSLEFNLKFGTANWKHGHVIKDHGSLNYTIKLAAQPRIIYMLKAQSARRNGNDDTTFLSSSKYMIGEKSLCKALPEELNCEGV